MAVFIAMFAKKLYKRVIPLQQAVRLLLPLTCVPFMLSSSCPSEEPPLPPRLHAPIFTSITTTGHKIEGEYREAIQLVWKPPSEDSNRVSSYMILRNTRLDEEDTAFSVVVHSIPAHITEYCDLIGAFGFPPHGSYRTIKYRITAIDTADQAGDTSAVDSFVLTWPPVLDVFGDTLYARTLSWSMTDLRGGYRSQMILWNIAGRQLESPLSDPVYGGEGETVRFSYTLPDTLWPLPPGVYFFGARIVAYAGEKWNREGIAIAGPIYVP